MIYYCQLYCLRSKKKKTTLFLCALEKREKMPSLKRISLSSKIYGKRPKNIMLESIRPHYPKDQTIEFAVYSMLGAQNLFVARLHRGYTGAQRLIYQSIDTVQPQMLRVNRYGCSGTTTNVTVSTYFPAASIT